MNADIQSCLSYQVDQDLPWAKIRWKCKSSFSADDILKYFSYFSQITGFDISYNGDNLHERSNSVFWGKKIRKNINLSYAELTKRVIKVKIFQIM